MKGSETVVWATTPFGASEGDADTYETGTNDIGCASRAGTGTGRSLLGFAGGEKAHEIERGVEKKMNKVGLRRVATGYQDAKGIK